MQLELFLFHYSFYVVIWVLYFCLNSFSDKDIWSFWSLLLRNIIQIVLKFLEFLLNWDLLYISARLLSSILSSILPRIRVFSNESALHIKWPKYFSFSISPSNEHQDRSPLGRTGWVSLQSKGLSRVFSNTTVQKHQFFCTQFSL